MVKYFAQARTPYIFGYPGAADEVSESFNPFGRTSRPATLACVLGAEQFGASEKIFASVSASMPGIDWNQLAHYMIGRTALHAERRVHEMEEVARTLTDVGIDPIMASATARRIQTCADFDLKAKFNGQERTDYRDILRAMGQGAPR
jgi:hypothetical protein